jgi:hypothetical protein
MNHAKNKSGGVFATSSSKKIGCTAKDEDIINQIKK